MVSNPIGDRIKAHELYIQVHNIKETTKNGISTVSNSYAIKLLWLESKDSTSNKQRIISNNHGNKNRTHMFHWKIQIFQLNAWSFWNYLLVYFSWIIIPCWINYNTKRCLDYSIGPLWKEIWNVWSYSREWVNLIKSKQLREYSRLLHKVKILATSTQRMKNK